MRRPRCESWLKRRSSSTSAGTCSDSGAPSETSARTPTRPHHGPPPWSSTTGRRREKDTDTAPPPLLLRANLFGAPLGLAGLARCWSCPAAHRLLTESTDPTFDPFTAVILFVPMVAGTDARRACEPERSCAVPDRLDPGSRSMAHGARAAATGARLDMVAVRSQMAGVLPLLLLRRRVRGRSAPDGMVS